MENTIDIVFKIPVHLFEKYLEISTLNKRSLNDQFLVDITSVIENVNDQEEQYDEYQLSKNGDNRLWKARDTLEESVIKDALLNNSGNISKTAKELGISRPTLYDLMAKYGLD